jgi:hypothetical protein
LNCFRGQNNTTAAAHTSGDAIVVANLSPINVYPTPSAPGNQYTFVYYRMRRIQDAGGGVNVADIPFRLIPCMVAGLAHMISMKTPAADPNRVQMLKMDYEQQWQLAADEDREKAPARYVPRQLFY